MDRHASLAFGRNPHRMRTPSLGPCPVTRSSGEVCGSPSNPDMPFPICGKHAMRLYEHVRDSVQAMAQPSPARAMADLQHRANHPEQDGIVYWLQVGDLIKVGWTTNLKARLAAYPPDRKVLALEDHATQQLEGERIDLFRHLVVHGREWMRPDVELIRFLNTLRPHDKQMDLARFDLVDAGRVS